MISHPQEEVKWVNPLVNQYHLLRICSFIHPRIVAVFCVSGPWTKGHLRERRERERDQFAAHKSPGISFGRIVLTK